MILMVLCMQCTCTVYAVCINRSRQKLARTAAGSGTFTNGQITKPWADATGTLHTFTIPEFIALAEAVARYVDSVVTAGETAVANNQLPVWPSGPISIP